MNKIASATISAFRDELSKIAFNDAHVLRMAAAAGKRVAAPAQAAKAVLPGVAKSQGLTAASRAASMRGASDLGALEKHLGAGPKPPPVPVGALRPAARA